MATRKPQELFTYGDHAIGLTIGPSLRDLKNGQTSANEILQSIIGALTRYSTRISDCIEYSLELDYSAYSVYISGSVVELPFLDGIHSGYSLSISIFPGSTTWDNEADE